jgi:hypothetical protein
MSRALLLCTAALVVLAFPRPVLADEPETGSRVDRAPDLIDGAGMIDFSGKPNFSVGSWVRYRTHGSSLQGHQDDYTVTILIGGEEVWWGEPCFWVETWTQKGETINKTATMMSYSAFGDTMATKYVMWFIRKTVDGLDAEGHPQVSLYTRQRSELKLRRVNYEDKGDVTTKTDTLQAETVVVPAGRFETTKIQKFRGYAQSVEEGDSTVYYRRGYTQYCYRTTKVPIACVAKIDIDDKQEGKTWLAGQFSQGPLRLLERSQGTTELIEYGTGGLTPAVVPESARHSIANRKLVEQAYSLPMEPPVKALPPGRR